MYIFLKDFSNSNISKTSIKNIKILALITSFYRKVYKPGGWHFFPKAASSLLCEDIVVNNGLHYQQQNKMIIWKKIKMLNIIFVKNLTVFKIFFLVSVFLCKKLKNQNDNKNLNVPTTRHNKHLRCADLYFPTHPLNSYTKPYHLDYLLFIVWMHKLSADGWGILEVKLFLTASLVRRIIFTWMM